MNTNIIVSVIIYNNNCDRLLTTAIESVLQQTNENIEVIVVDDGSSDNSRQVIDRYQTKIIALLQTHLGEAVAFNSGFTYSRGKIICLLDSGDFFLADKLEKITTIFSSNLNAAWCFHSLRSIEDLEYTSPKEDDRSRIYDVRPNLKDGKFGNVLPIAGIETSALCFRRSLLEKLMPIPENITAISNDYLKYTALGTSSGFILVKALSARKTEDAQNRKHSKQKLQPKIHIITAYWLKNKFPELAKFADNIFTLGWSDYRKMGERDVEVEAIILEYLKNLQLLAKLKIRAKKLYYQFK